MFKKFHLIYFVGILCVFTLSPAAQEEIGKWKRHEVVIPHTSWEGDPYEVELKGIYQSPSGRVLEQWGFYAGEDQWKIFFMPDETGSWTFTTTSSEEALDDHQGEFQCVSSDLPGKLTNDGPHWLLQDQGGVFPVLWNPPVEDGVRWGFRARQLSHPTIQQALDFAANTVGASVLGFDALLVVPTGWAGDWDQSAVPYVIGKEGEEMNFTFWDRLNEKLDAMRDQGMGHYIMFYSDDELTPDHFGLTPQSEREILYFRYALARLACYPIVLWDSGIDIGEYRSNDWVDWFVEWIKDNDPWQHPVGSRTGGGSGGKIPNGATYYSTGGAFIPSRLDLIRNYWGLATRRDLPVAHTDHWRPYISRGDWTHEKIRIVHWRCALSGAQALYPDYNQGNTVWEGVLQGGPWIGYATKFMHEKVRSDLRELLPDDDVILAGEEAIAAGNPGKEYVVYAEKGGSMQLDVSAAETRLHARWYNPRTGKYTEEEQPLEEKDQHTFSSPTQGQGEDWVLHIYQISSEVEDLSR